MRWIALAFAVAAAPLAGCHTDPECSAPPVDAESFGAEAEAVAATDAFIREELAAARAAGGLDAERLGAAARGLGFSDSAELSAAAARGCAGPGDLARFSAARGLSAAAAKAYLRARFDVPACAN